MYGALPEDAILLFHSQMYEKSGGRIHWNVLSLSRTASSCWLSLKIWHNTSCDVRGITDCIVLGAAASHYNILAVYVTDIF